MINVLENRKVLRLAMLHWESIALFGRRYVATLDNARNHKLLDLFLVMFSTTFMAVLCALVYLMLR